MIMEHSAETAAGAAHEDHSLEQRAKRKERVGLVVHKPRNRGGRGWLDSGAKGHVGAL